MTAVAPTAGSPPGGAADPVVPTAGTVPLLPGPTMIVDGTGLASIDALLSQTRASGFALGEQEVATHRQVEARAFADEMAAIRREEDNQRGSGPGFVSCISRFVGHVARDLAGGRLDAAVADARNDLDGAWNSPRYWSDLEKGLTDVAALAGGIGSVAGLAGGPVGAAVGAAAQVVQDGASVGVALATSREEGFGASATAAHADVVWERSTVAGLDREISAAIDTERSDDGTLARALQSVAAASLTSDRTSVLSTTWKG